MVAVELSPTMINTLISGEEEGDSHEPPIQGVNKDYGPPVQAVNKDYGDIETIVSTNEGHKQRGKPSSERNAQSPIVSHRSLFPKVNPQSTTAQQRKPQVTIQVMMKKGILLEEV